MEDNKSVLRILVLSIVACLGAILGSMGTHEALRWYRHCTYHEIHFNFAEPRPHHRTQYSILLFLSGAQNNRGALVEEMSY